MRRALETKVQMHNTGGLTQEQGGGKQDKLKLTFLLVPSVPSCLSSGLVLWLLVARLLGGILAFLVRACLFSCPAPVCFGFWCFCAFFSVCGFARFNRYPLMATTVHWIAVEMD